jgi:hypothetical protein
MIANPSASERSGVQSSTDKKDQNETLVRNDCAAPFRVERACCFPNARTASAYRTVHDSQVRATVLSVTNKVLKGIINLELGPKNLEHIESLNVILEGADGKMRDRADQIKLDNMWVTPGHWDYNWCGTMFVPTYNTRVVVEAHLWRTPAGNWFYREKFNEPYGDPTWLNATCEQYLGGGDPED